MLVFIYIALGLGAGVAIGFVLGQTSAQAQIEEEERPWKTAYETLEKTNKELDAECDRLRKMILTQKSSTKSSN